jgi:FKBP12-rapamycin complex-associated protein
MCAAQVAFVAAELKGDAVSVFNNDLNRRIFELTHSPSTHEKLGGIVAIGEAQQQASVFFLG